MAAAAQDDFEAARRLLEESLAIAREIADRTQEIFCQGHLGALLAALGEHEAAVGYFSKALALAETVGSRSEQSWLHAGLAASYRAMGEEQQAAAHAREALDDAAELERMHDVRRAQEILAQLENGSLIANL